MNTVVRHSRRDGGLARLGVVFVMVGLGLGLLSAGPAAANVRLAFPEDTPGPPFYARALFPVPADSQWVPVVFYRDPGCVPAGFNLLSFFDVPGAFGCGLMVEGFEIWERGPGQDPAPIEVKSRGLGAVPVWFVSRGEYATATADGVLTIGELQALPSLLTGTADNFQEVLHPSEAARHGKLTITASGSLADGRSFQLQFSGNQTTEVRHLKITFR